VSDNGAYNAWGSHALLVAMQTVSSLYRVPSSRIRSRVVYTNKAYGGSVRGFGNPEATFAVEQQTEELAAALGIDAMDLRLRNANQPGDVTAQGMRITSCGLTDCLLSVRRSSGWDRKRGAGRARHRGVGAAAFIHVGGGARIYPSDGCGSILKIDEAGRVTLITGASELGQGSETVLAMVAAETLGVPLSAVRVVNDDTELKPWDVGAHASRTTFVAGNSARLAAAELRDKLLETAGDFLEADVADLQIEDGLISVKGSPGRSVDYARVARRRMLRQGGSTVLLAGRREARLKIARGLGIETVNARSQNIAEEVRKRTSDRGADVVIECTGREEVWEAAPDLARRGGTVSFFGGLPADAKTLFTASRLHYDEIRLVSPFHFTPSAVKRARDLLAGKKIDPLPLITETVSLSEIAAVFERLKNGEGIKFAVTP